MQLFKLAMPMLLLSSASYAQTAVSREDASPSARHAIEANRPSPGTVGAMTSVVAGLATSATDVQSQQEGGRLSADGGGSSEHPVARHSPGTVDASPGYTAPNGR